MSDDNNKNINIDNEENVNEANVSNTNHSSEQQGHTGNVNQSNVQSKGNFPEQQGRTENVSQESVQSKDNFSEQQGHTENINQSNVQSTKESSSEQEEETYVQNFFTAGPRPKKKLSEEEKEKKKEKLIILFPIVSIVFFIFIGLSVGTCTFGHKWGPEATCTEPQVCKLCGEIKEKALGHSWSEATCTKPETCTRCGITEGKTLPHTIEDYTITKAATCTETGEETGICTVCHQNVTQAIPAKGHSFDIANAKITTMAGLDNEGVKTEKCSVCGKTNTIKYSLTPQEKANIDLVRYGIFYKYPSETIGTAFDSFFADTAWFADGDFVYFRGDCTWLDEPSTAYIRFAISGKNFVFDTIEIGEDIHTSNLFEINSVVDKIYSHIS